MRQNHIIYDYLGASYIGEQISKYSERKDLILRYDLKHYPVIHFKIKPVRLKNLVDQIYILALGVSSDDSNDKNRNDFNSHVVAHENKLSKKQFQYPEIIDNYYANLVNGLYFEFESEYGEKYLNREYKKYPERKYGFWKSAFSEIIGKIFYTSIEVLIVPKEIDLGKLFNICCGFSNEVIFESVNMLTIKRHSYLVNNTKILYFPMGPFLKAKQCISSAVSPEINQEEFSWMENIYTFDKWKEHFRNEYGYVVGSPDYEYLLSDEEEILLIKDKEYNFIFFRVKSINI